jgi:hypothetical protein
MPLREAGDDIGEPFVRFKRMGQPEQPPVCALIL